MEEVEQGVSTFPDPPKLFYKLYTDENVQAGLAPKPPPVIEGSYSTFGRPFDTNDPILRELDEQGITKIYPDKFDSKEELKRLNGSIVISFLELLDVLINCPSSPQRSKKIEDLKTLFVNMHHLVNGYRPHQARETLKVIMERQKKQRDEAISILERAIKRANSMLVECHKELDAFTTEHQSSSFSQSNDIEMSDADDNKMEESISSVQNMAHQLVHSQDIELCQFIDQHF